MARGIVYESSAEPIPIAARGPYATAQCPLSDDGMPPRRRRRPPVHANEPAWPIWPIPTVGSRLGPVDLEEPPPPRRRRLVVVDHPDPGHYPNIGVDSLKLWLTGAVADGGAQADVAASLGGFRSSSEVERVGRKLRRGVAGLRVGLASRANGLTGTGSLSAVDADTVVYSAPGSLTPGAEVVLAAGVEKTICDGDPSKWIRATRIDDEPLAGVATVECFDQFNRFAGFGDVAAAAADRYRALALKAAAAVSAATVWLPYLGPAATTAAAQLGGSGGGTVAATDPDAFAGWELKGWAEIRTSGDVAREIVYYASRTDAALTVAAGGRGRLGTSATAGAASDLVYPVPPLALALEVAVAGEIQTIADDATEPSGLTWSTPRTAATAAAIGALAAGDVVGLWLWRELPAVVAGYSRYRCQVELAWTSYSTSYRETLSGLFRVAQASLARYELYVGVDEPPDLAAAPAASAAAIADLATAADLDPGTYYMVVQRRSAYDLVSQSIDWIVRTIDGVGETANPPRAPELQDVVAVAGGCVRIHAVYFHRFDGAAAADEWLIYLAEDVDPDPETDTPVVVAMARGNAATALTYVSEPFALGVEVRCLVRARRSSDAVVSASSEILTVASADVGLDDLAGGAFSGAAEV